MVDLAWAVAHAARTTPEKTAVVEGQRSLTYAELDEAVSGLAHGLRHAGLAPGDVVALQLGTGIDFVISFYGTLRAGMIAAPLSPQATERESRHALELSCARALITGPGTPPGTPRTDGPGTDDPHPIRVFTVAELLDAGAGTSGDPVVSRSPAEVAVIIFTSGTTGAPKAAQLSHANLWMSCTALLSRSSPGPDDVVLSCLPLHHVFGMSGQMNAAMAWGMTLVLLPKFEAATVLDLIARHRVTRFSGVPTMFVDMLAQGAGGRDLSSLRYVTSGGSALQEGFAERFEEMVPSATLLEGYGSSETTSSVCVNSSRTHRRHGSVGTPSWGTQMRLVSEEGHVLPASTGTAAKVPVGELPVGELQVRGPTVFCGYAGDPAATDKAFDGDWLRTGDVARIDHEGYVHLVDRTSNMIIRGGLNVYPAEVEQVLTMVPGVREVAVLGHPDERLGEEVAALVVTAPGQEHEAILHGLEEQIHTELASYKRPRVIELVDELPRSAAGKVLRPAARELLAARLAHRPRQPTVR